MNQTWKRFLSLILALSMAFSLMVIPAYAAPEDEDAAAEPAASADTTAVADSEQEEDALPQTGDAEQAAAVAETDDSTNSVLPSTFSISRAALGTMSVDAASVQADADVAVANEVADTAAEPNMDDPVVAAVADELGLKVPTTMDELVEFAKAFVQKDADGTVTRWGFEMFNDYGYYQASFLWQLGESMVAADGTSPALEGTSMLKQLTDWQNWVKEGWCRPFDSTNASSIVKEMLYQGKIGCYLDSSGSMKNNIKFMTEGGYELGVARFPTYNVDKRAVEVGGGQIALIGKGNTEEQIEAGWEFLKFLMTDEQVYLNSTRSGYLPITKSVATYEPMLKFWEENPSYKIPFDQMQEYGVCQEYPTFSEIGRAHV